VEIQTQEKVWVLDLWSTDRTHATAGSCRHSLRIQLTRFEVIWNIVAPRSLGKKYHEATEAGSLLDYWSEWHHLGLSKSVGSVQVRTRSARLVEA